MTARSFLIADDHWAVRKGVRETIQNLSENADICEAKSHQEVLDLLQVKDHFDLILLDLAMPGMSPHKGFAKIRARVPTVPLVILSGTDDPSTVRDLMKAGASGFIHKSQPPEIVLSALRLVLAGGTYIPPSALDLPEPDQELHLTDRQMQVLHLLAEGSANKTIARELGLALPTVKIHVAALLRRLSATNRTEAVRSAMRSGLIKPDDQLARFDKAKVPTNDE